MALFSSWLYVRVSWLYFLPGYMKPRRKKSHNNHTYKQEENKAMTPSHITRKKIKPCHPYI
jgi:hypothetical protein